MEQSPRRPPEEEPRGPEDERLYNGEIDLTGVVQQDDALADVIGDAIGEAEDSGSEVPEWGARTLARALANERDDPFSGALHQFAVTGRVDPVAITGELADLHAGTEDETIQEWVSWLGNYLHALPDATTDPVTPTTTQAVSGAATEGPDVERVPTGDTAGRDNEPEDAPASAEVPIFGSPLEQVTAYLSIVFDQADARGEAISDEDAQIVAQLLGELLGPTSVMARFAESGEGDPLGLIAECQQLRSQDWQTPDVNVWAQRLEQHLGARQASSEHAERGADAPQSDQGISEHGDAFRAFLKLEDINHNRTDLLDTFRARYVGTYDSIAAFAADLNAGVFHDAAEAQLAAEGRADDYEAPTRWDIVEINGSFYVFSQ